jgi:hypothetical protein
MPLAPDSDGSMPRENAKRTGTFVAAQPEVALSKSKPKSLSKSTLSGIVRHKFFALRHRGYFEADPDPDSDEHDSSV